MTSKIKVDNINKVSDDSNIINKCGTTITLGASGDSIALASGATQTGFGRTGTVDWQTGSIKTSTFTAANGEGYFINSGSAITMNLPAGSAGAIVAVSDYARNFATYNLTISPDGSEKIGGIAQDATLNINGQAATFVYVDSTKGWVNVQNAEDTETGTPPFITACGGTVTTSGNCKIHTFTGPGTFTVNNLALAPANNVVGYLVVGAGGGGGTQHGGGGGAGGFREGRTCAVTPYTVSPLAVATGITATVTSFPITVGSGGAGDTSPTGTGAAGGVSTFSTITSAGGGGGASYTPGAKGNAGPGGSGGGASGVDGTPGTSSGGTGNIPSVSPSQGNPGGNANTGGTTPGGAGGGGATSPACGPSGSNVPNNPGRPADEIKGGIGATTHITGSPVGYAGGGGGGKYTAVAGGPASDGGGSGGPNPGASPNDAGVNGTANKGGGGGGASNTDNAANGGSGVVIIRYKFQ